MFAEAIVRLRRTKGKKPYTILTNEVVGIRRLLENALDMHERTGAPVLLENAWRTIEEHERAFGGSSATAS